MPTARPTAGPLRWQAWLLGWLPLWLLFTLLVMSAHGVAMSDSALISVRMIAVAALLARPVFAWCARLRWPLRPDSRFVLLHVVGAIVHAVVWVLLNSVLESLMRGRVALALGPGLAPYLATGVWLYALVAGISYAIAGARRAAASEALASQAQLAALRNQLHPHFLFNALHTVVQLIPLDPRAAQRAGEQLGSLLREVLEQRADVVPLEREWALVQRYLDLESLRLGARLQLKTRIDPGALPAAIPAFALQTLVENAVLHAVAQRVEPTLVSIGFQRCASALRVEVWNDGGIVGADALAASNGTGLKRLRERLAALYGDDATLQVETLPEGGVRAVLHIPQHGPDAADD